MARLNKKETNVNINPTSAAPARRKAAAPPRKRAAVAGSSAVVEPQETVIVADIDSEIVTESAVTAVEFDASAVAPGQEEIAALAYSYWEERGYTEGSPEHDWLRAEAELRQRALVTA
jgi:hypothetical protein